MDSNNNVRCIKKIQLVNASNAVTNTHFEMIQQEIYLLQNLAHPRIIGLYEYFCTDNDHTCIYIVMEFASRGSLSRLINNQQTFFDEHVSETIRRNLQLFFFHLIRHHEVFLHYYSQKIKQFFIDMVMGVEYLHMKNVIHKDLKPCNILICDNERLKIADFGVSKITNM